MASVCTDDALYWKMMDELEVFYGETPNRRGFMEAIKTKLEPRDIEVWLLFPKHTEKPITWAQARELDQGAHPDFDAIVQKLLDTFFLSEWDEVEGVKVYVRNYIFKIQVTYSEIPGYENDPMTIAGEDWFNSMVLGGSKNLPFTEAEFRTLPAMGGLTGKKESTEVDLGIEIPDTREVVTFDYVQKMLRERRTICLTTCNCRVLKEKNHTRKCDFPLETCMLFDDLAERTLKVGGGRQISVEEAIEITKRGSELGLVHNISNAENPSVLCQCCSCCCLVLNSMFRGESVCGKPSRYLTRLDAQKCEVAEGCTKCVDICPAKALSVEGGRLRYDTQKCIGCGLCVENCPASARSLLLRHDADKYLPDVDHFDILYI